MTRLVIYAIIAAVIGAGIVLLLTDGLQEGAVAGAVLGASFGLMVAMRKGAGDSSPSFEYEAASIHDDNLITTARRNLVREAYRQHFTPDDADGADQPGERAPGASAKKWRQR